MSQSAQRIPCPRCRSNNFLGVATCFNCGASLPPPEAVLSPQPPSNPVPVQFQAPRAGFKPSYMIVPVILVALLGVIFVMVKRAGGTEKLSPANATLDQLTAMQEKMMRERGGDMNLRGPAANTNDPMMDKAKKELERLNRQIDARTSPSASGADTGTAIQNSGRISNEEWRKIK